MDQQGVEERWAGVPESARDTRWPALLAWAAQHAPVTGPPERVRAREWSASARLPTATGPVWVKAAARGLAAEPVTTALLAGVVPHRVLTPLAVDADRGWLLLPDAGATLADRGRSDEAALRRAHDEVADASAGLAETLLAAGVPDRRPATLPALLDELTALLAREGTVPPTDDRTRRAVARWAGELASRPGAAAVDHLDVHAGNAARGPGSTAPGGVDQPLVLLDWGDAVLTHPHLRTGTDAAARGLRELVRAGTWARTTARARREHPLLAEHLGAVAACASTGTRGPDR